jgi:hypothetical protein
MTPPPSASDAVLLPLEEAPWLELELVVDLLVVPLLLTELEPPDELLDELPLPVRTPPSRAWSTHCPPTQAMTPGHWMPLQGLSTQTPPEQTWP